MAACDLPAAIASDSRRVITSIERMLFELHGPTGDDDVDPTELGDDEDGPPMLRVRASVRQVVDFIDRARKVVAAGRPACPFCQQPLDPGGHICPRANGYRRRG